VRRALSKAGVADDPEFFTVSSIRKALDSVLSQGIMTGAFDELLVKAGGDGDSSDGGPADGGSSKGSPLARAPTRGPARSGGSVTFAARPGAKPPSKPGSPASPAAARKDDKMAVLMSRHKSMSATQPGGSANAGFGAMGAHQRSALPDSRIKGAKQSFIVVRANEAMNNAVGHKVSKLTVLSEKELSSIREMFEMIAGGDPASPAGGSDALLMTHSHFMQFLDATGKPQELGNLWSTMDPKGTGTCDLATMLMVMYPGAKRDEIQHMVQMAQRRKKRTLCTRKLWDDMLYTFSLDGPPGDAVLTVERVVAGMEERGWKKMQVEKVLGKLWGKRGERYAIRWADFELWFTTTVSANNLCAAFERLANAIEVAESSDRL